MTHDPRHEAAPPGKSARIEVRTSTDVKALLTEAAQASHKTVTEFLVEAGVRAAEDALIDRRVFRLDDARWAEFQAALDRPVTPKPRLARLLAEKSVLE
jgi:uncharacterized protein (DUF1778 family)